VGTTAGTLASGTLTFSAGGIATTTLSYPAAADGSTATLTLSGESVPGANARRCCIGSTCSTADTCVATFKTAGFIFANTATGASATLPTQTAGTTSGTTYLRAVKTSTTTQACESALSGAQSVNWGAQCNNPTTCSTGNLMSLSGNATTAAGSNPIASNPNTGVSSTTSVDMTFDANGSAPFSFNYADVGLVTLSASKAAGASLLSALSGSTNAFVVKPGGFTLSNIKCTIANAANCAPGAMAMATPGDNPAASLATGASFLAAGKDFKTTVTATTSGVSGALVATPNFGKETAPEGVLLTPNLVAPSGGAVGALSNATIAGGSFSGGATTVTNLAWSEVGIITLTPSVADGDYLGAGAATGAASGNIGRFIPDHFAITAGTVAPACSNAFTYFGQDFAASPASNAFATPFTLTAQNLSNGTTQNYTDGFANLVLTTWGAAPASAVAPGYGFSAATLPAGATLSASVTAPTGSWPSLASAQPSRGVASVTAKHKISRPTTLTGITSLTVSAAPADSDGVTMAPTAVGAASNFYYGRLRMLNAYGSELLALPMSLTSEYWTTTGWAKNTLDGCTSVPVPTSASGLAFGSGNLSAGETVASIQGTTTGDGTLTAGDGGFRLSKPGALNNGFVTITIATPDWLKFPWVTSGVDVNATARATFGIYKSPLIYRRENY
jgi:MSHA biogenesis protein MshQ